MIFSASKDGMLFDLENNKIVESLDEEYFKYSKKLGPKKKSEITNLVETNTFKNIEDKVDDEMFIIKFNYADFSDNFDATYEFVDFVKKLGVDKSRILCEFGNGNYNFDQINRVIKIHNKLAEENIASCFETSTIEEAINYNTKAREFVYKINNMEINGAKLSPFEKYVLIYRHVADRYYTEDYADLLHARNHISAYTGDKVVCVGFAKLLAQLCKECGINCQVNSAWIGRVDSRENTNAYNHKNNIVYIDDPKYRLQGVFLCDACWDSKNKSGDTTLAHMLVPLNDLRYLQNYKVMVTEFQKDFQTIPVDEKSIEEARTTLEETYIKDIYSTSCLQKLALQNLRNDRYIQEYCFKKDENLEKVKSEYNEKASNFYNLVMQDKEKLEALGFDFECDYKLRYKKELIYFINGALNGYNLNYDKVQDYKIKEHSIFSKKLNLLELLSDVKEEEIVQGYKFDINDIISADKMLFNKMYLNEILNIQTLTEKPKNITLGNLARCLDVVAQVESKMYGIQTNRKKILNPTLKRVTAKVTKNENGYYENNKATYDLNKTENWVSQFWRQNFANSRTAK